MVIIGDLHGGYPEVLYSIKKHQLKDTSFIQVGDWGLSLAIYNEYADRLLY